MSRTRAGGTAARAGGTAARAAAAVLLGMLAPAPPVPGASPAAGLRLGEQSVEIARAELVWRDGKLSGRLVPATGGTLSWEGHLEEGVLRAEWEARDLDARTAAPALLRAGAAPEASGQVDASGRLTWSPGTPPQVRFRAELREGGLRWLDLEAASPLRVEGRAVLEQPVRLPEVRVHTPRLDPAGPPFREVELVLAYADRVLEIRDAAGSALGVEWSGSSRVHLEDGRNPFELSLLLDTHSGGAPLEVHTPEGKPFGRFERAQGELHARGVWTPGADLQALEGDGRVEVGGGRIRGRRILPAVWNALVGVVPFLKLPSLPAFLDEPLELDQGRATFEIREGAIHTDDLRVVTAEYAIRLAGRIGLDGQLHLDGQVDLTPLGVTRMFQLSALTPRRTGPTLTGIPIRVRGSLREPAVEARVARLPLHMIDALFRYALPR